MTSSSNLLLLNVEDILGFAQLKAGKFVKNIKKFNIKRAVEDIVSIQQYQAESKEITIETEYIGFPSKNNKSNSNFSSFTIQTATTNDVNFLIESDEKRIKQVLINLQSNALKFTKHGGKIKIIVEYVRPKGVQKRAVKSREIYDYDFSSSNNDSSSNSDDSETRNFEMEH